MVAVPRTMEAIRLHAPGVDGLRRETIATPSLQLGEALVEVHAAAITRDKLEWPLDRLPAVPSYELSGIVAARARRGPAVLDAARTQHRPALRGDGFRSSLVADVSTAFRSPRLGTGSAAREEQGRCKPRFTVSTVKDESDQSAARAGDLYDLGYHAELSPMAA